MGSPPDNCAGNADIFQFHGRHLIRIFVQYGEIGALANFNAANLMIHFQRICCAQGNGMQGLINGEAMGLAAQPRA